jgi:hypothetical protein
MSGEHFRVGFRWESPNGVSRLTWSEVLAADDVMAAITLAYRRRPKHLSVENGYRLVEAGALALQTRDVGLPPQWPLMQLWNEGHDADHDDRPGGEPDEQNHPQVERGPAPRPREPGE